MKKRSDWKKITTTSFATAMLFASAGDVFASQNEKIGSYTTQSEVGDHISSGENGWEHVTSTRNAIINAAQNYEITSSSAYTWGNSAINYHTKSSVYSTKIKNTHGVGGVAVALSDSFNQSNTIALKYNFATQQWRVTNGFDGPHSTVTLNHSIKPTVGGWDEYSVDSTGATTKFYLNGQLVAETTKKPSDSAMFNIGSLSSAANQLDVLEVQSVSAKVL
ncbi:hypothetical protein [Bacillus cereus]|uniref:Uncharacterized protein n=1 Tax=Bacillus cereus VD184 TaxID=1053242 RepID=A0A9W5R0X4_BACCE|nr:hypothetical protein [Bacillus cereus]EOQ01516.1 hypothetical protein IKC_06484 [Bacillus cereus VD184]